MASNDLLSIWAACLEAIPDEDGKVLTIKFPTARQAANAGIELYRLRKQAQKLSKRDLPPDDPRWGTSPWDAFRVVQPGRKRIDISSAEPILHIYLQGHGNFQFEIIPNAPDRRPKPRKT